MGCFFGLGFVASADCGKKREIKGKLGKVLKKPIKRMSVLVAAKMLRLSN